MLEDRHYMRQPSYRSGWSMTTTLIVINVAVFLAQLLFETTNSHLASLIERKYLALSIDGLMHGYVFQLITFQFLHAGFMHIFGNMLAVYFFGRAMEDVLGGRGLLKLYLLCGVIGGLVQLPLAYFMPERFGGPLLGASAGAFGLIAAFATQAPNQPITMLLFFVLPLSFPAKVLLMIEAAMALIGIFVPETGVISARVAHAAHLGGMLTGILYIKWLGRSQRAVTVWQPFRRSPRPLVKAKPLSRESSWKQQPPQKAPDLPPAEFMAQEVDPILDKISAHGIQSLTDRERQILEAARKRMGKR